MHPKARGGSLFLMTKTCCHQPKEEVGLKIHQAVMALQWLDKQATIGGWMLLE